MMSTWIESRRIATRMVITGDLILETPAHLGGGERSNTVDMTLLRDTRENRSLLPGSSIAGALRSYLRTYEYGDFQGEERSGAAALLFGGTKDDDTGNQSPLIVEDSLGTMIAPEIRDGVRINATTRTAEDTFKFDMELLPAGTLFPLRFELLLPDDEAIDMRLRAALALALRGLESGEISIGARKSRGYGRCIVREWKLAIYQVRASHADLVAWLAADHPAWTHILAPTQTRTGNAERVLGKAAPLHNKGKCFTISATFALESPMLIRSEQPLTSNGNQPDVSHLRDNQGRPIIAGTSLAGVLRARAGRILNAINHSTPTAVLNIMFGKDMQQDRKDPIASHLIVHESLIKDGASLVQNRVAIDRFTGGASDTALFSEAPHVGGKVTLSLVLRAPQNHEKGLLLLLLKDLWTGDLPLGGSASIGRGRLRGISAQISDDDGTSWTIETTNGQLHVANDARLQLERYVSALAMHGRS